MTQPACGIDRPRVGRLHQLAPWGHRAGQPGCRRRAVRHASDDRASGHAGPSTRKLTGRISPWAARHPGRNSVGEHLPHCRTLALATVLLRSGRWRAGPTGRDGLTRPSGRDHQQSRPGLCFSRQKYEQSPAGRKADKAVCQTAEHSGSMLLLSLADANARQIPGAGKSAAPNRFAWQQPDQSERDLTRSTASESIAA